VNRHCIRSSGQIIPEILHELELLGGQTPRRYPDPLDYSFARILHSSTLPVVVAHHPAAVQGTSGRSTAEA
jgi:hypothetical protein